jgi:hypothetical protein
MKNFRIVSYYTVGTPYVEVCHKFLMPSLKGKNIKSDIIGIPNFGSWLTNTSYKATFIKLMLEKHPEENVVFLDSDATIEEYPKLFEEIPEEYLFGCHFLDRAKWYNKPELGEEKELLSGTLFCNNCLKTKEIINEWIKECSNFPKVWEQRLLARVLKRENIKVYELPLEYTYIKTLPNGESSYIKLKPIILHHQVSRKLKNKI